jgi:hypothetical protein
VNIVFALRARAEYCIYTIISMIGLLFSLRLHTIRDNQTSRMLARR